MKIAIISPNRQHLQDIERMLLQGAHTPITVEGGKSKMRDIAEQEQPDVMFVEGMCCDPADLAHVEDVTTHFPAIAVVLICASTSAEFLINSMRAGVREVLPSPATQQAIESAVQRIALKQRGLKKDAGGKVIAFCPCKGGSGATFLATNLAYLLAESKKVLLIDLNLQFGDALSFVNDLKPATTLADVARDIHRLDASFLDSSATRITPNLVILAAPDEPAQSMEVKPEHIDAILELAVREYDFVVLDLPRAIDAIVVKALDRADIIFPVLQAGLPELRNASKLLNVFRSLGYPARKVELVLNRFDRATEIGLSEIANTLGALKVHLVQNSYKQVHAAINHGDPMSVIARSNAVSRNLADMARALSPEPESSRSLLDRFLRRA